MVGFRVLDCCVVYKMVPQFIKLYSFMKGQFSMIKRAIASKPRTETVRQRVYLELRRAMEQGTFKPGTRLPASREQAKTLGVSRNSVLWAMERLQSEGYVVARVGDGSYVADDLGALHPTAARRNTRRPLHAPINASLSQRGQLIADTVLRW